MAEQESEYETSAEEETESESEEEDELGDSGKEDARESAKEPTAEAPSQEQVRPAENKTASTQEKKLESLVQPQVKQSDISGGPRRMTHARKQNLKSLMLNKAREDLKIEAEHKAEEKKKVLNSRIEPLANLSSMSEQDLKDLCRELYNKIETVDEQRYDIELRVKKNDTEIDDLNQRIFDLRGKFKRPPLRRVRMSADQMLRALLGSKHKVSMDLRSNLKSVKKEETKKEEAEVKDWRENVEAKSGMGGKKAVFEQSAE